MLVGPYVEDVDNIMLKVNKLLKKINFNQFFSLTSLIILFTVFLKI